MQSNFEQALKYVLLDEGGNDDDPRDHGGRTSRGITQREYDAFCRLTGRPVNDVWQASNDDIRAVYKTQYWNPYCDSLPSGLDYLFFDISVNAGRSQAVRTFQKALGVNVDGMVGQVTLDAIHAQGIPDASILIKRISDLRRAFYRHLKQYPIYGKGWLNRVDHSEKAALAMAAGTPHEKTPAPSEKSDNTPASPTVNPTAAGGITGTFMAIINQFKDDIQNLSTYIPDLNYVLLGIAVVGFGYMAWGFYKQNQVAKNV